MIIYKAELRILPVTLVGFSYNINFSVVNLRNKVLRRNQLQ